MAFAASPMLVLTGLINWDLLAVACVAGAFWAWSRGRPLLTGVMIGLGTATKLYPLFLLGALLVVCVRRARLRAFAVTAVAAAVSWLLVNLPAMCWGFEQWKVFWSFNDSRRADLGSLWLVAEQAGHSVPADTINTVSLVFFGAVCVGVLVLGLLAPQPPRIAQLGYLLVAGFLLVNKVYSPQYVLWLLPLAVLARPRWRDLLVWQAGELLYFAGVWLYLGEFTASASSGQPDHTYWFTIVVRVAAEVYLAVMVVRDVLRPEHDPVRADGLTDDPLEPPLVEEHHSALPPPGGLTLSGRAAPAQVRSAAQRARATRNQSRPRCATARRRPLQLARSSLARQAQPRRRRPVAPRVLARHETTAPAR